MKIRCIKRQRFHPLPPFPTPPLTTAYAAHNMVFKVSSFFNVSGPYNSEPPLAAQQRAPFIRRNLLPIIMSLVIITGAIVLIILLIILPRLPHFHVANLTLSNFNVTSTSLVFGNWDAHFTVHNPNSRIDVYCDHIKAAVFYKGEAISETSMAPFDQSKKARTAVRATFATWSAYVDNGNGIRSDLGRGTVEFRVMMVARVRFTGCAWCRWARARFLLISCPDLSVGVSGNHSVGSLLGGSKRCKVSGR